MSNGIRENGQAGVVIFALIEFEKTTAPRLSSDARFELTRAELKEAIEAAFRIRRVALEIAGAVS